MAEQPLELRRINWSECCGFTHIFRSFRMAIQPGKLGLALIGVLATFIWGWCLDGIWRHGPLPGELHAHWQTISLEEWRKDVIADDANRLQGVYANLPGEMPKDLVKRLQNNPAPVIDEVERALYAEYEKKIKGAKPEDLASISRDFTRRYRQIEDLRPQGIFTSFVSYESEVIKQAMDAGISLNITGGLREVLRARHDVTDLMMIQRTPPVGVLGSAVLLLRGKQWLVCEHFWFALLLCAGTLAIWSLVGGAICRIAALNFARDERISPKAASSFAVQKYLGFLTAPLLPIGIIVVVAVLLFLGGVFMSIPVVGEFIGTLTLPLALLGGFVITMVIVGFLAGGSLFYPTIAVEGSDSFDAMSRSYSYIFAKPWRALFYGLVAFIYGALCTLFVRLFALVMLKSTRLFLHAGTNVFTTRPGTGSVSASKIQAMWTNPTFDHLWSPPPPFGAHNWEGLGAWLIALWVAIVIALVIGFVVSFYYCASTVIYFLLRREVDATDIEDVYLEDEEAEMAGAGMGSTGTTGSSGLASASEGDTAGSEVSPPPPPAPPPPPPSPESPPPESPSTT